MAAIPSSSRRLVKVVIIDPNPKVPLDQCVIHNGGEQLTDLTDQELFFEIDLKTKLDAHNSKRIKEFLEPAKIRDLRMVVVVVAQF